jgi:hypothetical protein
VMGEIILFFYHSDFSALHRNLRVNSIIACIITIIKYQIIIIFQNSPILSRFSDCTSNTRGDDDSFIHSLDADATRLYSHEARASPAGILWKLKICVVRLGSWEIKKFCHRSTGVRNDID